MKRQQTKQERRARLNQNMPSNIACLATIGAMLLAVALLIDQIIPGSQFQHRASSLYWAILLPFAWWAVNLGCYEPAFTRTLVPANLLAPVLAIGCLLFAILRQQEIVLPLGVSTVCLALSCMGAISYRRSLLRQERTNR